MSFYLLPRKLTYLLKINGWKFEDEISFGNGRNFWGEEIVFFFGGSRRKNTIDDWCIILLQGLLMVRVLSLFNITTKKQ